MSFRSSREAFLVLDKNSLRAEAAKDAKCRADRQGIGVLIPDVVIKEIVRNGDWRRHFRADFSDWADKPERFHVAKSVGELLREERDASRPATSVVDEEITLQYREMLRDLGRGDDSFMRDTAFLASLERRRQRATEGALNAAEWESRMESMVNEFRTNGEKWFGADTRRLIQLELTASPDTPLCFVGQVVLGTMASEKRKDRLKIEYSSECAAEMVRLPTFTNLLFSVYDAYALILWSRGWQPNLAGQEKLLNQILDVDYVAFGLHCLGLATRERLLQRIEAGLRCASDLRWPE